MLDASPEDTPPAGSRRPSPQAGSVTESGIRPGLRLRISAKSPYRALGGKKDSLSSVTFSSDGQTLASSGFLNEGIIKIWNTTTGKLLRTIKQPGGGPWLMWPTAVKFAPNGRTLASATSSNSYGGTEVKLWEVGTGQLLTAFTSAEFINTEHIAFSPDGHTLAGIIFGGPEPSKRQNAIAFWDAATGQLQRVFAVHTSTWDWNDRHSLDSIEFSPKGQTLAAATTFESRAIELWDVGSGQMLFRFEHGFEPMAFSPDGRILSHRVLRIRSPSGTLRLVRCYVRCLTMMERLDH